MSASPLTGTTFLSKLTLKSTTPRGFVKEVQSYKIVLPGDTPAVLMRVPITEQKGLQLFITKPTWLGVTHRESVNNLLGYAQTLKYLPCPARAVLEIAKMVIAQKPFTTVSTDSIVIMSEPLVYGPLQYALVVRKIATQTAISTVRYFHDYVEPDKYLILASEER